MTARLAPTHDIKPEDERTGRESSRKEGKFSDCECFTNRRGKKVDAGKKKERRHSGREGKRHGKPGRESTRTTYAH